MDKKTGHMPLEFGNMGGTGNIDEFGCFWKVRKRRGRRQKRSGKKRLAKPPLFGIMVLF